VFFLFYLESGGYTKVGRRLSGGEEKVDMER